MVVKAVIYIILVYLQIRSSDAAPTVTVTNLDYNHVLSGSPFTFICEYTLTDSDATINTISWTIQGNAKSVATYTGGVSEIEYRDDRPFPDYSMTYDVNVQGGSTNYTIRQAGIMDNATLECNVNLRFGAGNDKDMATVIINVPPSSTVISDGSGTPYPRNTGVIEGLETILKCTAEGHTPAATIRWTLNGRQRGDWPDGKDTSIVTFVPELIHHGNIIECTALVPADDTGVSTLITLDVKVPPTAASVKLYDDNNINGYDDSSDTTDVLKNQTHVMTCFIEGTRPEAQVIWRIDGQEQTTGVTTTPTQNPIKSLLSDTTSTFSFTPSQCSFFNNKEIECETKIIEAASTVLKAVTLKLQVIPDTPVISFGVLNEGGGSQDIQCESANGYPAEGEMRWQIADKGIMTRRPIFDTNDELCQADMTSIYSFEPLRSDNGVVISCEVHHPSSDNLFPSTTTNLDVKFCSESFTGPGPSECTQKMVVGSPSPIFTCMSESSHPASTLSWYLNNSLQENTSPPQQTPGAYNGIITTQPFQIDVLSKNHNGVSLQCEGSHPDITTCTNRSIPCTLNVLYPPKITMIEANPSLAKEGDSVSLTCEADANPQPDNFVSWFKGEQQLHGDYSSGRREVVLAKIDRKEAGTYKCTAVNDMSMDSMTVDVTVHYSPNITNKEENSRGAHEGSEAVIQCRSQSNPEATTSWFNQNGQKLINNEGRVTIVNKTLSGNEVIGISMESELRIANVQPLTDYGNYSCIVKNAEGEDSLTIHLNGTRRPDNVKQAIVTASSLTSLTVEWTPGYDGGEDQWFLVAYRLLPDGMFGELQRQNNSYHTITELISGTQYEITIFSENVHGMSERAELANGRTRQIPDPPASLEFVAATETSLSISWVPGSDGGDPQWFLLDYGKSSEGLSGKKLSFSDIPNKTRHDIGGLTAGTEYVIAVYSENRNGINTNGAEISGSTLSGASKNTGLPSSTVAVICGVVIGPILLLIITILILVLKGTKKSPKGDCTVSLSGRENESRQDGISNTYVTDIKETAVDGSQLYSKVNKNRNKEAPIGTGNSELYAKVNKSGGTNKETDKSELYAKVNKNGERKQDEDESVYDDVANVNTADQKTTNDDDGKTISPDGIIYTEVGHFKPVPADAPPIQTEESTEYAELNFLKLEAGNK